MKNNYPRYALDERIECFFNETKRRDIEEHVQHEAAWGRVCVSTTYHDIFLRIHATKLCLEFLQHLANKEQHNTFT